jgi:hypothetical protein
MRKGLDRMMEERHVLRLIGEIERHKNVVRREYEEHRKAYIEGTHRKLSLTKRECENRVYRLNGEIMGHEYSLSILYTELNRAHPQYK